MGKVTTNSGIPVFGEIVKLIDKQEVSKVAEKLKANRYTKRLDAYQHLIIMLYAVLGQFNSLRDIELGFYSSAQCLNHFGLDYMVRRSTLSEPTPGAALHFLSLSTTSCTSVIRPF